MSNCLEDYIGENLAKDLNCFRLAVELGASNFYDGEGFKFLIELIVSRTKSYDNGSSLIVNN
jgi:hypothetical protein